MTFVTVLNVYNEFNIIKHVFSSLVMTKGPLKKAKVLEALGLYFVGYLSSPLTFHVIEKSMAAYLSLHPHI